MKLNVAIFDSVLRVILALIIFALGLYFQTWLGIFGFVFLLTGVIGFCPIYAMIGFSTRPMIVIEDMQRQQARQT